MDKLYKLALLLALGGMLIKCYPILITGYWYNDNQDISNRSGDNTL